MPDLLARIVAGDEVALAEIMAKHRGYLHWYAGKFICDRRDAEEVTQEAFLQLWRRAGTIANADVILPWLLTVTRNRCYDLLRTAITQWHLAESNPPGGIAEQRERLDDQVIKALAGETARSDLEHAVERLTPKYRAVIAAYHFDGLTMESVSAQLEIPLGTVKSRLNAARIRIRKLAPDLLNEYLAP